METKSSVSQLQTSIAEKDLDHKKLVDGFLYYAKEICPGFLIDDSNKATIDLLLKYIANQKGDLDLNKGLFVHGLVGCGKTVLIKALIKFKCILESDFKVNAMDRKEYSYKFYNSWELRNLYETDGVEGLENLKYIKNLILDDVGFEGTASHFGNEIGIIEQIILTRYEFVTNPKSYKYHWPTFLSSNHTYKQLHEIYGERFVSRLKQMCNDIYLPGGDRRK